jgi:hypothetical protein
MTSVTGQTSAFQILIIFHLERIVVWFQGKCQLLGPCLLSAAASCFLFAICGSLVGSYENVTQHIVLPNGPATEKNK